MLRPLGAATLALSLSLGLVACTEDEPEEPSLQLGDDATGEATDPSPEGDDADLAPGVPEPRSAPEQGEPIDGRGYGVHALELPSPGPARDAAQAFVDYLDERTRTFNTGQEDLVALSGVALGEALTSVQRYAADLRERDARTVGDTWLTITDDQVRVRGRQAQLSRFCIQNASVDVGPEGLALESPPDYYRVDAQVDRVGPDAWLVVGFTAEAADGC